MGLSYEQSEFEAGGCMNERLLTLLSNLREYDNYTLMDILDISTDDLVDSLRDFIEDNQEHIEERML